MVLALNTPFNSEVLVGRKYGILWERDVEDLHSKIQFIEDHPDVAQEYRRQAPERIREAYTWDRIVDEYEALFKRLVYGEESVKAPAISPERSPDEPVPER